MLVLTFTTSTDRGGAAVADDGKVLGHCQWAKSSHGSEVLTLKIKQLLDKLKIKPGNLEGLAVDRGPGSFTGCRIAANVAKTMAFALGRPVIAFSSLDLLAHGVQHEGKILAVLDAHKALLFARWYESDGKASVIPQTPVEAVSFEVLQPQLNGDVMVVGQPPQSLVPLILKAGASRPSRDITNFPRAKVMAALASTMNPTQFQSWKEIEPIYIRAPDAVEKRQSLQN